MRLPSRLRLKATRDFARVREGGHSYQGRCVVLGVLRLPGQTGFQFGLITSRKVGPAVVRNRIRRRLREIVREQQELIVDGLHLVIIARWRAAEASLDDLRADSLRTARKAGILRR
jgi:ribonuclease P protein component